MNRKKRKLGFKKQEKNIIEYLFRAKSISLIYQCYEEDYLLYLYFHG